VTIGINYGEFILSSTIAAGSVGDEITFTVTTGPRGEDVAELDAKQGMSVVVWAQKRLRPHLDPDAETMAVVDVTGSGTTRTVKVIRAREGSSAGAHATAGTTYVMTAVFSAGHIETSVPEVTPQMFGADAWSLGGSVPEIATPFRRMASYSLKNGNACRIPHGIYRIATAVDVLNAFDYGDDSADNIPDARQFNFRLSGAGMEGGTEIRDEVSSGPMLKFERPSGCSSFRLELNGITFKNAQTSGANKDAKFAHAMIELEKMTHLNSVIRECSFRSLDSGQKADALVRLVDCFMVDFERCYFDLGAIGTGVRLENPTINGGECGFPKCHFNNVDGASIYAEGSSVIQQLELTKAKFVGSGGHSRIRVGSGTGTIGDFTAAATVLDIGTGHTLVAGDALWIGNDNKAELVYVSSYSSPDVTLEAGLVNDYSSDGTVEVIVGPFGFTSSDTIRSVDASNMHTEGVGTVICGCVGFNWDGGTATGTAAAKLSSGDAYHVFALGDPCYGHEFKRVAADTPGASTKLVFVINSGGSVNVPGPMLSRWCLEEPNDAVITDSIDWTATTTDKGKNFTSTAADL
jgi:hypothetical protein